MPSDRIDALQQSGEIAVTPDGQLRLAGQAHALFLWLDRQFERLTLDAGATPATASPSIARATLDRGGYLDSFSNMAVPADDADTFLAPAACYHVYASLAGQCLRQPQKLTIVTTCARQEIRSIEDVARLTRFRMREVVMVGEAAWVAAERDEWMSRIAAFADAIGLAVACEAATDTFFAAAGRGRRLIQQLKELKYELRVEAGAVGRIAAASFNLHEDFFAKRFDMMLPGGHHASSGCIAFGIERWTLACLAQFEPARIAALVCGGVPRSTMST